MKKFICLAAAAAVCILPLSACSSNKNPPSSEYDLLVIYDEEEQKVSGTVAFDYYNDTQNEISDLKFNVYGNAYREGALHKPISDTYRTKAYYAGESYGSMEIENVENCAGWTVAGEDENILVVNLAETVFPEERTKITITYTLKLAKVNHRTGVTADTVNLGNFYPILCEYTPEGFIECPYYAYGDPFVSDCANYRVTIDMPESYTAATSGQKKKESVASGRKKCEYSVDGARDFAAVLSDKFQTVTQSVDGVEVSYYYTDDSSAQVNLSAASDSLSYFSKTFGNYAYPTLSVVQTGFCYGGMEYPALTMISKGLASDESVYTIVHENAHQWWYAMVGSDQLNNPWQDEGLAEYSALTFFENNPTYGFTRTGLVKSATNSYRAFYTVLSQLKGSVDTSMTRNLSQYQSELEYSNIAYNKGLIMFDMLRNSIGDEKFMQGLKEYFNRNRGKTASSDDLFGCFLNMGTDLEGFFKSFMEGKVII